MPPSQLKRLKATLRAEGITGPQPSKKLKKKAAVNGANKDRRVQKTTALQNIRDQFNPFEVTNPGQRREKFEVTTNKTLSGRVTKNLKGRPGVTRGLGEENRRKTLLLEMQRRKKVGGIMDRRFGENDPTMTPEEKMLERFTKEKQRRFKSGGLFDLEDDEEETQLTHFGQSLSFDAEKAVDDFEEGDLGVSDEDDHASDASRKERKRQRAGEPDGEANGGDVDEFLETKKTKAEVMKEVIAKSKFHKYERQQVKEDDEDLRKDLDKELPTLLGLLRGENQRAPGPPQLTSAKVGGHSMNPARAAMMNGVVRAEADKEYDMRLKEMILDKRSKPTERTKTEEEKAEEEARRLRDLEERRLRRMRGEELSDEDEPEGIKSQGDEEYDEQGDADPFGLGPGMLEPRQRKELGVEDEDDFIIDDDLVANDSDVSLSDSESEEHELSEDEEDRAFLDELYLGLGPNGGEHGLPLREGKSAASDQTINPNLSFTFPCPQTHLEFLDTVKDVVLDDLPVVVSRIRALYHPKLHKDNKEKLERFSTALVDHIVYLANRSSHPSFAVLENLIRHVHSLAKSYPESIATAFRSHLQALHESRSLAPTAGDLVVLTAIGNIFPTSDHFHKVVTPAALCMSRYLGQKFPTSLSDLATGAYIETLCLQYQRISERYVPEVVNYALNALAILAPVKPKVLPGSIPYHEPRVSLRLQNADPDKARSLHFWDILDQTQQPDEEAQLKVALINIHLSLLDSAVDLWIGKSAFSEIFKPAVEVIQHLISKDCSQKIPPITRDNLLKTSNKLHLLLTQARISRRPLALHYHRPLAIRTSIPKFEDSYNPDKHYDPDRERAESNKLRAEYKKERKGAMRELRRDANFVARESLREKKERDREYEKKYKRLVAEIQGEEGHEKKEYERIKRARKGRK